MLLTVGGKEPEDYPTVCRGCYSSEIDNPLTQICKRCLLRFCSHYASKIDQQFCVYCLSDFTLRDEIIEKTVAYKTHSGKKTITRIMKARHLVFEGQDWMFAQARVNSLSLAELEATIEYHREILNHMLNEREVRRIAENRSNLKKTLAGIPTRAKAPEEQVKTKTTTKITATPTTNPAMAVQSITAMLKAKGMSDDDIKNALRALVGGKK